MEFLICLDVPLPCIFNDVRTGSRLLVPLIGGEVLQLPCCPHCYLRADLKHEHLDLGVTGAYKDENGGIPE